MRRLVLFMHVSLDGFVAGPNGEMDWISIDNEMFDYAARETDKADTAVYGHVTYEMMENYWPTAGEKPNASQHDKQHSSWYNKVAKVVASKTLKNIQSANTTIISENLPEEIAKLKQKSGKNIIVFGSPSTAYSLIAENLFDDYWLFVNPVMLGKGIPLFASDKNRVKLKFVASSIFKSGVICIHYQKNDKS